MAVLPRLAIVGRPNVGKSTLFNRLVGQRRALVHDLPGVTRDRLYGNAELADGRVCEVIDTGGLIEGEDPWKLWEQVRLAIDESDLVVLVVDGKDGPVPADEVVLDRLREAGKPVLLVVNKFDTREAQLHLPEFHRWGLARLVALSAEHGRGVEELREAILELLPSAAEPEPASAPPVAIVGRPNVGKSSLLNRLLGQERVLVSPVAGTTRDPIDSLVSRHGKQYLLIDTAGIRRRSRVTNAPDQLAVMMAERQIARAEIAVLVIDASAGVTSGDLSIAGVILEQARAALVVINKWDLLDSESRERLESSFERLDEILGHPLRVNTSAATGRGVEKIFPALERLVAGYRLKLET
nr:ribosome biogenesis GTPase Der [Thermoanaerobaculia bacterium]